MKNKNTAQTLRPTTPSESTHLKLLEQVLESGTTKEAKPTLWTRMCSLFKAKNDLTFEDWQRFEKKGQIKSDHHNHPFSGRGL